MSVDALAFLEKDASVSLSFLFLKRQQLIFSGLIQPQISHSAPVLCVALFILMALSAR